MNERIDTKTLIKSVLYKFVNLNLLWPSAIIRGYLFYDWKTYECQRIDFMKLEG